MLRFRIVQPDEDPDEIASEDLERLGKLVSNLRALLDSPIPLMERATALLEGTAERLL